LGVKVVIWRVINSESSRGTYLAIEDVISDLTTSKETFMTNNGVDREVGLYDEIGGRVGG
jgi:hypothetical protein